MNVQRDGLGVTGSSSIMEEQKPYRVIKVVYD
jgi:hypothetical protein